MKGGPFGAIQKVSESLIVPEKSGAMWGFLVCFRGSGRLFCFFFPFWTRTNEQKSGPYASKKTTHCKSRAHFLLKCAD